jgi:hypothetical protein
LRGSKLVAAGISPDARGMKLAIVPVLLLCATARADIDPNDPNPVTRIERGVSELDVGALGVLTYNSTNNNSTTQVSLLFGLGYQYFLGNNLSLGANFLIDYDRENSNISAHAYGGDLFAAAHLRLGLGAFFRPSIGLGLLFGSAEEDTGIAGIVVKQSETAFLLRLQFPFAYFPSRRIVLQAGPEIDMLFGSFTPDGGGDSTGFTQISGGFGIGMGYAF